jgi:translation initiation factor 1A
MPKRYDGEMFAQVLEQKGGSRMTVQCEDGKERLCRIPGRIRQRLWVKDGDYLIIKPWSVEGDAKCDLEYRYTGVQVDALRRRGLLKMQP